MRAVVQVGDGMKVAPFQLKDICHKERLPLGGSAACTLLRAEQIGRENRSIRLDKVCEQVADG